ncbi:hypothetical protein HAX54_039860 [Datura stramonium]|uniref:Uncharacterized protein n=1 Tax=Datura stramonium TaxID=4076 RepID=A0ABS8SJQ6_DATST|nr:hypothetical protein [Datura stramonium]
MRRCERLSRYSFKRGSGRPKKYWGESGRCFARGVKSCKTLELAGEVAMGKRCCSRSPSLAISHSGPNVASLADHNTYQHVKAPPTPDMMARSLSLSNSKSGNQLQHCQAFTETSQTSIAEKLPMQHSSIAALEEKRK